MPTYQLLGVSVWIPDFGDLVSAVTSPLQQATANILTRIGSVISPLLENVKGYIVSQIKAFTDPIVSRLQTIWSDIIARIQALIAQILAGLQPMISSILQNWFYVLQPWLLPLKPLLDQVWNRLMGIASEVWTKMQPWAQSLEALLRGDFRPLLTQILGAASWTIDLLGVSYPVLLTTTLGLGTLLDYLKALIQGQPATMEQIFAAKLNEVLNPLGSLAPDIWTNFSKLVLEPLNKLLEPVKEWVDTQVKALGSMVIDFIHSIASGTPEEALERTTGIVAILGPLITAVNIGAQAIEMIHPIKHMGIVELVTSCLDSMGVTKLASATFALLIAGALEKPLRQGLAMRYRPEIPATQLVDHMLFHQTISLAQWQRVYGLHGWSDSWISAWNEAMWTEPSDRMIVGMVEGGEVDLDWLQETLLHRGYNPETAARIMRYGSKKALANEIAAIISEINADLQAGQIDILEARQELVDIGCKGSELEFRLQAMLKRMNRNDVKDQVTVLTSQVKAYDLTVQQYSDSLIALGLRSARVSSLVTKEELRRKPTVDKPAERKRELAISFYQRLFIEGAIPTEDRLRTYLEELVPALPADRVDLVIEDTKIRQSKAVTAAA